MRQYLLLIRLPNVFTTPSNILTGYFAVVLPSHTNISNLSIFVLLSAFLFISRIIFNDYFYIEIDRKERPLITLVTGIIASKKAFTIALSAMVAANILAFTVDIISLIVAVILSATIIGYDYRLKQTMAGPVTMGSARFLNIFLGVSPAFGGLFFSHDNFLVLRLILVSMLMLLYVLSISILSRREISITTHSRRIIAGPFIIIFAIISIIVITLFFGF